MRRVDRFLALVIGLALAGVAVITGIEIVKLAAGQAPLLIPRHTWDHDLRTEHWGSTDIAIASGVLIGVGAVLFLLQLIPRKPVRLAVRSYEGQRVYVSRKGLARKLAYDITEAVDVSSAKVKVKRRKVRAKIVLPVGTDRTESTSTIRRTLDATLSQAAVINRLRIRVAIKVDDPPTGKDSRLDGPSPELAGAAT